MIDFFISYNGADVGWARWLDWQLRQAGYSTRVQVYDFRPGANFVLEMDRAAQQAERTLAVLSPTYLAALYTQPEWAAGFALDPKGSLRRLLPVRVRDCEPSGLLAQIVYIDLVGLEEDEAIRVFLDGLKGDIRPTRNPGFPSAVVDTAPGDTTLLPRYPRTLPAVWNVPHHRNPHFTGREALLEVLHETLRSGPAALTQTLRGLGGVGKTQLALEYTYRHAADYETVWWVAAEEGTTLRRDLAALALELGLVQEETQDAEAIAIVRRWLEGHTDWLLVFDNAADPVVLSEVLPRGGGGHVLITSRRSDWERIGSFPVEPFEREESLRFLAKRRPVEAAPADELADELGDLPLALEQAAAYLEQTGLSAQSYLELFAERRRDLLARGVPEDHEAVATTWDISFQALEAASPAAAALVQVCAFLAPDDIPLDLFASTDELPERLSDAARDPLDLLDAIANARRFTLIEVDDEAMAMHRLVQAIARDRCGPEARREWSNSALAMVADAYQFDKNNLSTWPMAGRLLPHAQAAVRHLEQDGAPPAAARLLNETGRYLLHRGVLSEARQHLENALDCAETVYGSEDPNVAIGLNNIGQVLKAQGDLDGALESARRALTIDETVYGREHPNVARDANNIGQILQAQGKLDGALEYTRRALAIDEAAYGKEHPNVAIRVNNIGQILQAQGKLDGALESARRALAIDETVYGKEHPNVARDANNIGQILQAQGDLDGALEHTRRALAIDEAAYGDEHSEVAVDANNLGLILQAQGKLDGALESARRALAIDEAVYGSDHPNVAIRVGNIGQILKDQRDLDGALEYARRALAITEAAHGKEHPNVAIFSNNIGTILKEQGDLDGARDCTRRALAIDEVVYGNHHPNVAIRVNNIGTILRDQGDLERARTHLERALRILQATLGSENPLTVVVRDNLAGL